MNFKNLLLIDDDADDLEIFVEAAHKVSDKVNCITFTDAERALKQLLSGELTPDVIFLDLNMPVMTGQEFFGKSQGAGKIKEDPGDYFFNFLSICPQLK